MWVWWRWGTWIIKLNATLNTLCVLRRLESLVCDDFVLGYITSPHSQICCWVRGWLTIRTMGPLLQRLGDIAPDYSSCIAGIITLWCTKRTTILAFGRDDHFALWEFSPISICPTVDLVPSCIIQKTNTNQHLAAVHTTEKLWQTNVLQFLNSQLRSVLNGICSHSGGSKDPTQWISDTISCVLWLYGMLFTSV